MHNRLLLCTSSVAFALCVGAAASPATYAPFTVTTPNDSGANTLQNLLLPGATLQAGSTYTTFSVEFDWAPDAFANARQWNAIWALTDAPAAPGVTFHADPGPAVNAQIALVPQFEPGTLRWVGVLNQPVSGSQDLYFNYLQVNAFTGTTWSDVSITLDTTTIVSTAFGGDLTGAPTWTRFRDTREGSFDTPSNVQNVRYEALPFFVETAGIHQFTVSPSSNWDAVIAVYQGAFDPTDPDANRLDFWVGTAPGTTNFGDRTIAFDLEEGEQYYFLITGRRSFDFGEYDGLVQGVGAVTFGIIPAPSALAPLALLAFGAARRR
ncbi:MAG: hypothetical protein EA379_07550 [Phycisphaerales bacterium]|nr:MAG: hypothetical protein EA379_07550 [Phycisphaerales bacterium]